MCYRLPYRLDESAAARSHSSSGCEFACLHSITRARRGRVPRIVISTFPQLFSVGPAASSPAVCFLIRGIAATAVGPLRTGKQACCLGEAGAACRSAAAQVRLPFGSPSLAFSPPLLLVLDHTTSPSRIGRPSNTCLLASCVYPSLRPCCGDRPCPRFSAGPPSLALPLRGFTAGLEEVTIRCPSRLTAVRLSLVSGSLRRPRLSHRR
jgi:hypothetical protein